MNKSILNINTGSQNSSISGLLKLIAETDGDIIKSIEPVIGFLHRGLEKSAETKTFLQYLPLAEKIDCTSGFLCQEAFCSAVEMLCEIDVPKRAKYIRVLLMELNRIASHLLWFGSYLLDLGSFSPSFFLLNERKLILKIFENLTDEKILYNFHKFGGVKQDLNKKSLCDIEDFLKILSSKLEKYKNILNNPIFLAKTKNIGILSKNTALNYSITGANLRASDVPLDFRKTQPYLIYNQVDFDIPTHKQGDCYSRFLQRLAEIKESQKIILQCIEYLKLTKGEINNPNINIDTVIPKKDKTVISYIESSRGLTSCMIISDGSSKPYRIKWRTGSFYSVQLLPVLLKHRYLTDITAVLGSLDIFLPEVDR